jgi:hypothetical protein
VNRLRLEGRAEKALAAAGRAEKELVASEMAEKGRVFLFAPSSTREPGLIQLPRQDNSPLVTEKI